MSETNFDVTEKKFSRTNYFFFCSIDQISLKYKIKKKIFFLNYFFGFYREKKKHKNHRSKPALKMWNIVCLLQPTVIFAILTILKNCLSYFFLNYCYQYIDDFLVFCKKKKKVLICIIFITVQKIFELKKCYNFYKFFFLQVLNNNFSLFLCVFILYNETDRLMEQLSVYSRHLQSML